MEPSLRVSREGPEGTPSRDTLPGMEALTSAAGGGGPATRHEST